VKAAALLLLASALLLGGGALAQAERKEEKNLVVSFDGGLSPRKLPRTKPAPVAVRVAGDVKTVKDAPLPQLRTIAVSINRAGRLYDKGLPPCTVESIQPATEREARSECGASIVGTGHVIVQVHIPSQAPFVVKAKLLAFNGPHKDGRKLILAQVYAKDPPGAFVLTFVVKKQGGLFGTVMKTTLPESAQEWAYMTHFDMTLDRRYRYRGKARSYISAACAAPAGFPGAIFPLAKATYGFDNGQKLTTTIVRTCRVRGS
jgi:hypothetical protein